MNAALQRVLKGAAGCAALFVLINYVAMYAFWNFAPAAQARMRVDQLTIEKAGGGEPVKLTVEVAVTREEKSIGLMFRKELADSQGMLFDYGQAFEVTMWMRNTYIPLDMLFVKPNGVIHRIEARTEPLSEKVIASKGDVSAVLEIPGGAADRLGIKPGDTVRHAIFKP